MTWSAEDCQAFADGNILKASTVPGKQAGGPSVDAWGDDRGHDWGDDADVPLVCGVENPETCESCQ